MAKKKEHEWPHGFDHTTGDGQKRLMYESIGINVNLGTVDVCKAGDYGCDPIGNGKFKMVPSGDIVNIDEMRNRLGKG